MDAEFNYQARQRTDELCRWLDENLDDKQRASVRAAVVPVVDPVKVQRDDLLRFLGTDGAKSDPAIQTAVATKLLADGVAVPGYLLPADMLAARQAEALKAADAEAQALGYKDAADRAAQEAAAMPILPEANP